MMAADSVVSLCRGSSEKEQQAFGLKVAGSIPAHGTNFRSARVAQSSEYSALT